jgi:hypothetical protein
MNKDSFIEAMKISKTPYAVHLEHGEVATFQKRLPRIETIIKIENSSPILGVTYCYSYWFFDKDGIFLGVGHYDD